MLRGKLLRPARPYIFILHKGYKLQWILVVPEPFLANDASIGKLNSTAWLLQLVRQEHRRGKADSCSQCLHSAHLLQVLEACVNITLKATEVYVLYPYFGEDTKISQTTKNLLLMNTVIATELAMEEEVCNPITW